MYAIRSYYEFEDALKEVTKAFLLDPSHEEAHEFEQSIYLAREAHMRNLDEARELV